MEQNLKELLLKDLCARVPHHPKGRVVNACNGSMCEEWLTCATFPMFVNIKNNCTLYLRPMSSMTEEEKDKLLKFGAITCLKNGEVIDVSCVGFERHADVQDYLNAHHFESRMPSSA